MRIREVKKLQPGDMVWWTDPDHGIGSRMLWISTVEILGDIVRITEVDGSYLECFHTELS
jgi:hypothetical protein